MRPDRDNPTMAPVPWASRRGAIIPLPGQTYAPDPSEERDLRWFAAAFCLATSAAFPVKANVAYVPFPGGADVLAMRVVVTEGIDGSRSWATLVYVPRPAVVGADPFQAGRYIAPMVRRLAGPTQTWQPSPGAYGRPPMLWGVSAWKA